MSASGYILGYASYGSMEFRHGTGAGCLSGGGSSGRKRLPFTGGSYSKSLNKPMASTYAHHSEMSTGDGGISFSGDVDFEMTPELRGVLLDKDFFKKDGFIDFELCDGEYMLDLKGCVWSSFGINGNPGSLVTAKLGFESLNNYKPDIELKNPSNAMDYTETPSLEAYWNYGASGVESFSLNFTREVNGIYLNEQEWLGPSYLRVGVLRLSASITCWDTWHDVGVLHLGCSYGERDGATTLTQTTIKFANKYISQRNYSIGGISDEPGKKTYNINAYAGKGNEDVFSIEQDVSIVHKEN